MVSRRWLFTLTMCFSPTAYLSCAFSLLLLFFRAQQFLNSFVRGPLVPFIQTRLVPSWSLPDYCTLPVEGRVKKTPGPYQHFTRDLNARSARHVQLFFFSFSFVFFVVVVVWIFIASEYWRALLKFKTQSLSDCSGSFVFAESVFFSLGWKTSFFFLKVMANLSYYLSVLIGPSLHRSPTEKKTKQNNGISVRNSRRRLSQKGCVQLDHNFCLWAGNLVWSLLRCFFFFFII